MNRVLWDRSAPGDFLAGDSLQYSTNTFRWRIIVATGIAGQQLKDYIFPARDSSEDICKCHLDLGGKRGATRIRIRVQGLDVLMISMSLQSE